jgi:hypothetical protein
MGSIQGKAGEREGLRWGECCSDELRSFRIKEPGFCPLDQEYCSCHALRTRVGPFEDGFKKAPREAGLVRLRRQGCPARTQSGPSLLVDANENSGSTDLRAPTSAPPQPISCKSSSNWNDPEHCQLV